MPELPEVETVTRGLQSLVGQQFIQVHIVHPKVIFAKAARIAATLTEQSVFEDNVTSKKIMRVYRRAKNIAIEFVDNSALVFHLKMTGQLLKNDTKNIPKYATIWFETAAEKLYFVDVRKFGYAVYFQDIVKTKKHWSLLGIEPFSPDFTIEFLTQGFARCNLPLKTLFLSQKLVVGIGNIYSDEICFAAGVLPVRRVKTLSIQEIEKIYVAILKILTNAIANGGSSISDYRKSDGSKGGYTRHHQVYGRAGQECYHCNQILQKMVLAGRTTVYCEHCQK